MEQLEHKQRRYKQQAVEGLQEVEGLAAEWEQVVEEHNKWPLADLQEDLAKDRDLSSSLLIAFSSHVQKYIVCV